MSTQVLLPEAPSLAAIKAETKAKTEVKRQEKRANKLHQALLDAGETGMLNHHMIEHGYLRYGSSIDHIRRQGFPIQTAHVEGGTWRYWIRNEDRNPGEAQQRINRKAHKKQRKIETLQMKHAAARDEQQVAQRRLNRAERKLQNLRAQLQVLGVNAECEAVQTQTEEPSE